MIKVNVCLEMFYLCLFIIKYFFDYDYINKIYVFESYMFNYLEG